MPAPISGEEGAAPAAEGGALTPMPTPDQLKNTELAELNVDEVPAEPAGKTTPQGEAPFDFADQKAKDEANAPAPVATPSDSAPTPEAVQGTALELPAEKETEEKTGNPVVNAAERMNMEFRARAGTLPAGGETAEGDTAKDNGVVEPAATLKDENAEAEAAAIPDLTPQLEEQKSQIADLQSKLNDQNADASKAQKDLQDSLKAKDDQIAGLQKSIDDLKKQLADAKAAKDSAKVAAAPKEEPVETAATEPEPAPAPKPVVKHAKPEPANDMAPAAPAPAKVVSWELKGAQPGKAILSSKATGDTRTVEIGDSVDGLGKITVIAKENGHWTVRGTKGQIVR
jgi:intracellular multiplication protein IcmG